MFGPKKEVDSSWSFVVIKGWNGMRGWDKAFRKKEEEWFETRTGKGGSKV